MKYTLSELKSTLKSLPKLTGEIESILLLVVGSITKIVPLSPEQPTNILLVLDFTIDVGDFLNVIVLTTLSVVLSITDTVESDAPP